MAITFPADFSYFFDRLPISEATTYLDESYVINENGYGEIISGDIGSRLWKMDITIREGLYSDLESVRSRLNHMRQAGRTFFAFPVPGKFPKWDPDGSKLGTASPVLNSVNSGNMRDVRLGGLPSGYRLYEGDYISFQYSTNPVRYALHQVNCNNALGYIVAGSDGIQTSTFEVTPNIRIGYEIGASVQVVKPYFKALIIPGSFKGGNSGSRVTKGISFSLIQTLRN